MIHLSRRDSIAVLISLGCLLLLTYAGLPPSSHAQNGGGLPVAIDQATSEPDLPAQSAQTVAPLWWQTGWFLALYAAGVLGLFALIYRIKANQLRAKMAAALAVRESEEKYRVLFESFPLGITVTDRDGNIIESNTVAEVLLGVPKAKHQHRALDSREWQIIYPGGTPMPSEAYASVIALREQRRVENMEMGIVKPDGGITWLNVTAAPIPLHRYGVVVTYWDISKIKQAEAALRQSEARYRRAQELGHVGNWEYNLQTAEFWGSDEARRIYGFDPSSHMFTTDEVESCIPERERVHEALVDLIEHGAEYRLEFDILRHDTQQRKTIISIAELEKDAANNPVKVIGVIADVTERKQAEAELRFHSQILQNMSEGVQLTRASDSKIVYANPTFARMFGYTPGELLGQHVSILNAPDQEDPVATAAQIGRSVQEPGVWQGEIHNVRKDGTTFWCSATVTQFDHAQYGLVGISVYQDITRRKQLEEERVRQERLAAVGQLAAGIAHDFNNLLMTIMVNANLLESMPETTATMKPRLARIVQQSERAARLTRQILDFSRQSVLNRNPLDLKIYLSETLKFIERTIPETIQVRFTYAQEDYTIDADPTGLQQVITNLAVNARDAMPHGGMLQFDLSRTNVAADGPQPCAERKAGTWVRLAVSDTGTGIAPAVLPHIFEPFFTTKAVSQGTGLGLAQIYGIVQQHNGCITVDSQVGQGATFAIYFPALTTQTAVTGALAAPISRGGGETILLVEDEQLVLEGTQALLEMLNYRVLTARNGADALTVHRAHAGQVTLVLTDAVMPTLDGFGLAAALQAEAPSVKVLLMSGYAGVAELPLPAHPNITAWLQKPLQLHELAQGLRAVLDPEP